MPDKQSLGRQEKSAHDQQKPWAHCPGHGNTLPSCGRADALPEGERGMEQSESSASCLVCPLEKSLPVPLADNFLSNIPLWFTLLILPSVSLHWNPYWTGRISQINYVISTLLLVHLSLSPPPPFSSSHASMYSDKTCQKQTNNLLWCDPTFDGIGLLLVQLLCGCARVLNLMCSCCSFKTV